MQKSTDFDRQKYHPIFLSNTEHVLFSMINIGQLFGYQSLW